MRNIGEFWQRPFLNTSYYHGYGEDQQGDMHIINVKPSHQGKVKAKVQHRKQEDKVIKELSGLFPFYVVNNDQPHDQGVSINHYQAGAKNYIEQNEKCI